ncbi:UROD/MetE-like protein [Phanerochaete sordida]|uniref:UROD/MetE-like protein n=1 Tax=Phanerochaete sordida TaxID=48140 RepID=A0A9P3LJD5_9APHY|nr:UROD/MetE-like protein [Phanerochaete sordida]
MSLKINPPHRAEHLGSLKRPQYLLKKREELDEKKCTTEELQVVEDEAIRAIVQMQREAGIKTITDGEFRRHMFFDGVFDNMNGMKYFPEASLHLFKDYVPDTSAFKKLSFKNAATWLCDGKLSRARPFYVPQFEQLKALTTPDEHPRLKITMCAPEWYHLRHGEYAYPKSVYANDEEYFADIAIAYQQEIQALYAAGCRHIQFDDPLLAYFCAESMISGMQEAGIDPDAMLDLYVRVYNDCLKGKPADMVAGLHLCRGNFKDGMHFSEGGYDRIAIKLFQHINVDGYYLEYDTPRAGSFEPLRFLPKNKFLVLGLVSSKLPQLEDPEELKRKVRDAATVIANGEEKRTVEEALNQICISPQCGFASHSEGNKVSEEDVKRKLTLCVQTSKQLWSDA